MRIHVDYYHHHLLYGLLYSLQVNVVNSLDDIRKNKRVRIPPKKREKKEEKIAGQLSLIFDDDEVDSYREWNSCVVVLINPDG